MISRLTKLKLPSDWLFYVLAFCLIGFFAVRFPADPDMGWHLASGQYLWHHWLPPTTDLFSWTMPQYPWIAHEWLTDRLMYGLYMIGGLGLLTTVFAGLIVLAFWLPTRINQFRATPLSALVGAALALMVCWNIIGVRPQMFTLLGIAITLLWLFNWRDQPKARILWWFPVLFLIWANFHGGFLGGIAIIGTFLVGEGLRRLLAGPKPAKAIHLLSWSQLWQLAGWGIGGGLLATLVNPYGWKIYIEVYETLSQPDVLAQISEWMPVTLHSANSYNAAILGIVLLVLVFVNQFEFDLTKLLLAVVFFFFGIGSWRHMPLFALASLPLLIEQLGLIAEHGFRQIAKQRWVILAMLVALLWWGGERLYYLRVGLASPENYSEVGHYPYQALQYVKSHYAPGKLVTDYGWGGYVIWQYPETKVFIDGRMAIWRQGSLKIFDEFRQMFGGNRDSIASQLTKWQPDVLVIPTGGNLDTILRRDLTDQWTAVYTDSIATVWRPV